MRKAINIMGWVSVILTILALVCTPLTTYFYVREIGVFYGYGALQICMISTMLIWTVKMSIDKKERAQNRLCSIFCTLIAVGAMFFLYMRVF